MKRRLRIAIIPAAVLLVGPWVIPFFVPWSGINYHAEEINIRTGQARYSRHLWYIRISQRVEDTILSRVLGGESVEAADIAPWHRVNTFALGLPYSPHCRFHGALAQAADVEMLFELLPPDSERRKQIARDILRLWQTTGSYYGVNRYLAAAFEEADKVLEQKSGGSLPEPNAPAGEKMDRIGSSLQRRDELTSFGGLVLLSGFEGLGLGGLLLLE